MAVRTDAVEGVVNDAIWFHYDLASDVLYLRLVAERETETVGEETEDGFVVLRCESDDRTVGLTIISWWDRFGDGALPDSIADIETRIEPLIERLAA